MRTGENGWKTTLSGRGTKTQTQVKSLALSECRVYNNGGKTDYVGRQGRWGFSVEFFNYCFCVLREEENKITSKE